MTSTNLLNQPRCTSWAWRWVPFLAACALIITAAYITSWTWSWLASLLDWLWLAMLLVLAAQIIHLWTKLGTGAGVLATGRLLVAIGMIVPAGVIAMINSLVGPSEDGFADHLMIPTNVHADDPISESQPFGPKVKDAVGEEWCKALSDAANQGTMTVKAVVPTLGELNGPKRDLLIRHLASSAAWRVFREDGRLVATRRLAPEGHWDWTLHGYYSNGQWDRQPEGFAFQFRVTLGLEGAPWWRGSSNSIFAKPGDNVSIAGHAQDGASGPESHLVIKEGNAVLEILEQAHSKARLLTPLAIATVEKELAEVIKNKGALDGLDRTLLPDGSMRRTSAELNLQRSFQRGIYNVYAFVNPGAPGTNYLKVWEVTRNVPLSESRLFTASNEMVGWSDDPEEKFFYNTNITIYEGDWNQFYAARFELWFKPDDGKPDQKLIERVFKIDGWMR